MENNPPYQYGLSLGSYGGCMGIARAHYPPSLRSRNQPGKLCPSAPDNRGVVC
eukprot:SAG31_NODE_10205_length_1171_cov_1.005597_1_plen_52_part_10